jgi:hypothetical protein
LCHILCHCKRLQAPETGRKRRKPDPLLSDGRSQRPGGYHKVLDGRKRPVGGLWRRNDRFHARLAVTDRETGQTEVRRVPLTTATTVAEAQTQLRRLHTRREDGDLPVPRRAPRFKDHVLGYVAFHQSARDSKRPRTLATERVHLKAWEGDRRRMDPGPADP